VNAGPTAPNPALAIPRLALVDLDGTLVDTVPDIAYCVDATLERLTLLRQGEERVRAWVGEGVETLLRRALAECLGEEPGDALLAEALAGFSALYDENTSVRSRIYPGVEEGLERLHGLGVRLACVTNKPRRFTDKLLTEVGLRNRFALVVAGDTLPAKKPDPLPLLHAARHFGVPPDEALLVGDSVTDVRAARAAGFAVVCVSYGYNDAAAIDAAAPDAVVDSFRDLARLLTAR